MKKNSYILHCYDNLVAMATSNNYFLFSCIWFVIKNLLTRLLGPY